MGIDEDAEEELRELSHEIFEMIKKSQKTHLFEHLATVMQIEFLLK